jgi:hypothetical protein
MIVAIMVMAGLAEDWMERDEKQGNIQASVVESNEVRAAIRSKSQANGSSITVGFTEKGFNACYAPIFPTISGPHGHGKTFRPLSGPG